MADFEDDVVEQPPADVVNLVGELPTSLPIPVRAGPRAVGLVHQDLNLVVVNMIIFHFELKRSSTKKKFYRINVIFWIVMGCGIAHFGRRGLKTT